jgi:hypothetical protein
MCGFGYTLAAAFSRTSIGILFLQLTVDQTQRYLIHSVILSSAITAATFTFLWAFQCHPVSFYWNANQDGACIPTLTMKVMMYFGSIVALLCDVAFAILPMIFIRGIKMDPSTKIALRVILGMGCM